MRKKFTIPFVMLVVLAILVTSCQDNAPAADTSTTETAQAAYIQLATEMKETAEAEPTMTMTAEPTAIPTSTPRPTEIPPTPTLELPVSVQTPVPYRDLVIDVQNADEVEELALYGMGTIEEIAVSPSGGWVAAATISGVSLYQTGSPNAAQHFLTNQSVRSVDFSPNGDLIAAGLQTGEVVILAIADGSITYRDQAHETTVNAVVYSPDGTKFASGDSDGIIILWNAEDMSVIEEIDAHYSRINDLAFSPDSMTLASGSLDLYTTLWDMEGNYVDTFYYQSGSITDVEFSNSGKYLASASSDYTVFIRNLTEEDSLPIVLDNDNIVRSIAFSPDDRQIAISGDDYGVDIWELFDEEDSYLGYLSNTLNHDYTIISSEYLPNGETLVTATWGSLISWWDVPNRETTQTIDRGFLIAAGIFDGTPIILSEPAIGTIDVYNAETLQNIMLIEEAHPTSIYQAALSPDQKLLVTASYDGYRIWDMATGEMVYEGLGYAGYISELKWSLGSELLGIGFNNGDVVIYDPATISEEIFDVSQNRILAIDFSSDLNIVATGGDDTEVNLWRRTDGDVIATLTGHIDSIYDVTFSPDGNTLATASSDYSVNIWQGITGDTAEYGRFITSLEEHSFRVKSVAFSPDGSLIASFSDDGTAMLWDAGNGDLISTLSGFTGYAKRIKFNDDGTLFYTWDWDGVMRIFGLPVE